MGNYRKVTFISCSFGTVLRRCRLYLHTHTVGWTRAQLILGRFFFQGRAIKLQSIIHISRCFFFFFFHSITYTLTSTCSLHHSLGQYTRHPMCVCVHACACPHSVFSNQPCEGHFLKWLSE